MLRSLTLPVPYRRSRQTQFDGLVVEVSSTGHKAAVKAKHKRDEAARLVRRGRASSEDCCKIRLGVALHELRDCLTFLTPFLSERLPRFPWLVNSLPQWRKPMDLNIRIIRARDFLKATPSFQVDLEKTKQFFLKLARENAPPREYDLLIDLRGTTGE